MKDLYALRGSEGCMPIIAKQGLDLIMAKETVLIGIEKLIADSFKAKEAAFKAKEVADQAAMDAFNLWAATTKFLDDYKTAYAGSTGV